MCKSTSIKSGILAVLLLTGWPVGVAFAGDYAEHRVIGFSPDGHYFAFEQFGIRDGSGFAYSDIFIIDTMTDRWIQGSPFRTLIDDESAELEAARRATAKAARAHLTRLNITSQGFLLVSNPRAELSADPHRVVANHRHLASPPAEEPITFTLTEQVLPDTRCTKYTELPIKKFTLVMARRGKAAQTLHRDDVLPGSRGCALGYAIAKVIRHEMGGYHAYAVLIRTTELGFEGPDVRYLAVTRRLPESR